MADENDDYEIGALLAAPVRAIQDAQIEAERQFVEFLFDYGLDSKQVTKDGKTTTELALREVTFNMNKDVPDPTEPGTTVPVMAEVRAPLLSLIQMPAIGIEEADIALNLDVQVEGEAKAKSRPGNAVSTKRLKAALPTRTVAPIKLSGAVGNAQKGRSFRTHGKLDVKLKLKSTHDDDFHGRLARLISEGLSASVEVPDN